MNGKRGRKWAVVLGLSAVIAWSLSGCGAGAGAAVRVVVPNGSTLRIAADSLERAGVIGSARLFRLYAALRHDDRGIKAGTYLLHRHASWNIVLDALRGGKGLMAVVTVPEGYSLAQIVPLLAVKLAVPVESVQAAVRDSALRHRLDVPAATLEGYLFPDTYTFPPGTRARAAVQAMAHRFEQVWKPQWTLRLDSLPMSRNDVVTLASIVEKEARLPEERPVIAAVYLNRLKSGMLLQADPTVQYLLPQHTTRVLYKDLTIDSPYNTYKYKGLPPGPIASPGAASIRAALYPANVPYRYFVAFPDGHHEFRATLSEHDIAKGAARRAWDSTAHSR